MIINWLYVKNIKGKETFYDFRNYKNVIIYGKNSKGKTILVSELLHPFGISHDYHKTNKNNNTVIVNVSHNNKTLSISRRGDIYKAMPDGQNIFEHSNKKDVQISIFDYFSIKYFSRQKNADLFKSLFVPSTFLQESKQRNPLSFIDFHMGAKDDNVYPYWANAFIDEFKISKLKNEELVIQEKLKDVKKKIQTHNDATKYFEKYVLDDDIIKREFQSIDEISKEIIKIKESIEALYKEKMGLDELWTAHEGIKNAKQFWIDKYKKTIVTIYGHKFTIHDFIRNLDSDIDLNELRHDIETKKNKIDNKKIELKNKFIKLEEFKSKEHNYIYIKNHELDKIKEKHLIDLKDKDVFEKESSNIKESIRSIKNIFTTNLFELVTNSFKPLQGKIQVMNSTGEYNWLKISTKSSTGFEPKALFVTMQQIALDQRGFIAPIIYDAILESADSDNKKLFTEKIIGLSEKKQIFFSTNKEDVAKMCKEKMKNSKFIIVNSDSDPITDDVKNVIHTMA